MDTCLARLLELEEGLPPAARIIRGLPGKLGGGCIRRARDTSACAFSASFLHAMTEIQAHCKTLWEMAWDGGRNPVVPQCGILSVTVPYFVSFTDAGSQWARPSTDEEVEQRRLADGDRRALAPRAESRSCTNGPQADSQLEALVLMRKL